MLARHLAIDQEDSSNLSGSPTWNGRSHCSGVWGIVPAPSVERHT
jgi:hypothetical protein